MGYVRAKIGLTGQFDRRQPGNYLQPWLAGNSPDVYTAKSSDLLHFGSCILDTYHLPRVASKFVIELVANHNSCKDAIDLGVAQWLAGYC